MKPVFAFTGNSPWLVGGLVLFLLLGQGPPAAGQQPEKEKTYVPYQGTQAFLHLLGLYRLKPIPKIADLGNYPANETMIVMFGDLSDVPQIRFQTGGLKNFATQGGSLLIASDRRSLDLIDEFGLILVGNAVKESPKNSFRGHPDCPMIKDKIIDPRHPIFKGIIKGIATNEPTSIEPHWPQGTSLYKLADFSLPELMGQFRIDGFLWGSSRVTGSKNRVLIMGGHGVFINGMMVQRNYNDNFLFAHNCVDWLTEGRKKKNVLFIEEGRVHTKIDVPLAQKLPFPIPTEAKINQLLKIAQDEDFFHKMLFRIVSKNQILRGLFLILTVLFAFLLLIRLFRSQNRREPRLPLVARTLEKTTSPRPVVAQRHDALIGHGNLREVASSVARLWLEEQGAGEKRDKPPLVEVVGTNGPQHKWQKQLNYLWELAWGKKKAPVARKQLRSLMEMIDQLNQAVQKGNLRLKPI